MDPVAGFSSYFEQPKTEYKPGASEGEVIVDDSDDNLGSGTRAKGPTTGGGAKRAPAKVGEQTTDVASIHLPRKDGAGPLGGRITKIEDVTDVYLTQDGVGATLPVLAGPREKKTGELSVKVPIGLCKPAEAFGPEVVELVGDPRLVVSFRAYRITEVVGATKDLRVALPPEEYIRPGWYGDCWAPANIHEPYYDFLGTGSVTEATQVHNESSATTDGIATSDAASIMASALEEGMGKLGTDQLFQLALAKGSSIEEAVVYLALIYSIVKQAGFDADAFVQSYAWRPIATMVDVFGSSDLKLSADGERVEEGIEGFHSRAAGPYKNLFGIIIPNIEEIVGVRRDSIQAQRADKRQDKMDRVLAYVARTKLSKAILG